MNMLRATWSRVSLYLPVVLMGVLALGTYWLVRSTPVFTPPEPEHVFTHEPDYYMKRFSVKTFDTAGKLKSEVFGLEARHYPDTDLLEIDQARIHSFDMNGRLTTATARRAVATTSTLTPGFLMRATNSRVTLKMKSPPNIRWRNAGICASSMPGPPRTSAAHLSNSWSSAWRLTPDSPIGFCSTIADTSPGRAAASGRSVVRPF